jgi:hypothetical protein
MQNSSKYLLTLISVLLIITAFFMPQSVLSRSTSAEIPVEPRLIYPVTEEVNVSGPTLLFKWWHAAIKIDRFEFKLYKGGGSSGEVVVKKTLPFNVSSFEVESSLLENNQTYTWCLRQVGDNGLKSEKSFITFRVIKK